MKLLKGYGVIISKGKISDIVLEKEVKDLSPYTVVDAEQGYIMPGFIDIHTHGGAGSDFMDATFEDFTDIVKLQASHGVTGLLATTLTAPMDYILKCLQLLEEYMEKEIIGSKILGVHLEGPFLSYKNKGAHDPLYLLEPTYDNYSALLNFSDVIKLITIAPELTNAAEMIKEFSNKGIIISGGHDAATEEEVIQGIKSGMTHTTHAYCVMSTISRDRGRKHIGLTEMMLLEDKLTTEIIADNRHTPPSLAKLIFKCKGSKGMCVVSDCLRPTGLPSSDELYKIGPRHMENCPTVIVDGDVAMLPDRSLFAGSLTTMDKMVKNLVEHCDISLVDAVRMASLTPAEIIRVAKNKGSIEKGKDADICIMDKYYNVKKTIVEGKIVFSD